MKTYFNIKILNYQLLLLACVTCFVNGCGIVQSNKQIVASESVEPIQVIKHTNTLYWGTVNMKFPNNMSQDEYLKIRRVYYNLEKYNWRINKRDQISNAKSWQEAHLEAKNMIESTRNDVLGFEIAQETASSMLRSFFLQIKPTIEVEEAVDYYMNILIKYEYYREPNLFAQILPKLANRWTKERINEIAQKTIYENTFFFKEKFSSDNQFLLKAQQKLKIQEAKVSSENYWTLRNPVTQEEVTQANQLKENFRANLNQVINNQTKKLNHKDWGEWVFSYIDALIILDMISQ